jgi:hypothetical protein
MSQQAAEEALTEVFRMVHLEGDLQKLTEMETDANKLLRQTPLKVADIKEEKAVELERRTSTCKPLLVDIATKTTSNLGSMGMCRLAC